MHDPGENTLTKDAANLTLTWKPVVLITISSKNADKPDYPTAPDVLHVEKPNAASKVDTVIGPDIQMPSAGFTRSFRSEGAVFNGTATTVTSPGFHVSRS
jgi:hypothetical protein